MFSATEESNKITLTLPQHSYPIYVGEDLLQQKKLFSEIFSGKQILIVTQQNIAEHYLAKLQNTLRDFQCDVHFVPQGEQHKNLQEWQMIFDTLLQKKHDRSTTLISLGGGMVGDITGFAAACYQRGVNYIQIPTSLIAQVDSAVGGKTGINLTHGKNMIGAFHHPQCVIADVKTLNTLPRREYISGLAEVVKYGFIYDEEFFSWLEKNIVPILNRESEALMRMISRCVAIKTDIVQQDAEDRGLRNILNFGHTFGHAIETASAYQEILHGEAVAWGMCMALELSCLHKFISAEDVERGKDLLRNFELLQPQTFPFVSDILTLMQRDKKNDNQKINCIVLKKIGAAIKMRDVSLDDIEKAISSTLTRRCAPTSPTRGEVN